MQRYNLETLVLHATCYARGRKMDNRTIFSLCSQDSSPYCDAKTYYIAFLIRGILAIPGCRKRSILGLISNRVQCIILCSICFIFVKLSLSIVVYLSKMRIQTKMDARQTIPPGFKCIGGCLGRQLIATGWVVASYHAPEPVITSPLP